MERTTGEWKRKQGIGYMFIIMGMILFANTNNNPVSFVERIFKPLKIGNGTLHYANIFPILLIYYGLKGIYQHRGYSLLETSGKRILATIGVLLISIQFTNYGIMLFKSMNDDLTSIYYHRDEKHDILKVEQIETGKIRITGTIELENCSTNPQTFYVHLMVPGYFQEEVIQKELQAIEDTSGMAKSFMLQGREKKRIDMVFLGEGKNKDSRFTGSAARFEFDLLNEDQRVRFLRPSL